MTWSTAMRWKLRLMQTEFLPTRLDKSNQKFKTRSTQSLWFGWRYLHLQRRIVINFIQLNDIFSVKRIDLVPHMILHNIFGKSRNVWVGQEVQFLQSGRLTSKMKPKNHTSGPFDAVRGSGAWQNHPYLFLGHSSTPPEYMNTTRVWVRTADFVGNGLQ